MKRIITTVVTVVTLSGLALGVLAVFGDTGRASAAGHKVAPEPYQAAHAWAWSGTGTSTTIPIPTGDRASFPSR